MRHAPHLTALILVTAVLSTLTTAAYNQNVHLDLTRYLAESAGLSTAKAIDIAKADQHVDDDPATSPFHSIRSRRLYHFIDRQRLDELRRAVLTSCAVSDAGYYFHALEDSYSHEGFGPVLGQGIDPTPDLTYTNVPKAVAMAHNKYDEFAALGTQCTKLLGQSARTWPQIEPTVRAFAESRRAMPLP